MREPGVGRVRRSRGFGNRRPVDARRRSSRAGPGARDGAFGARSFTRHFGAGFDSLANRILRSSESRRAEVNAKTQGHLRSSRHLQSRMLRGGALMAALVSASSQPQRDVVDYELLFDCVHCGLCLEACPTYIVTRAEMDSPRGRIYLMKSLAEGRLELDDDAARHLDLCLGCRGCETACPSGVHYGRLIEDARAYVEHHHTRAPLDRAKRA